MDSAASLVMGTDNTSTERIQQLETLLEEYKAATRSRKRS
jgi:hypothetical protein